MPRKLHLHAPDCRLRSRIPPLKKRRSKIGRKQRPLPRVLDDDPASLRHGGGQFRSMHAQKRSELRHRGWHARALLPPRCNNSCHEPKSDSAQYSPLSRCPPAHDSIASLCETLSCPAHVPQRTARQTARILASERVAGCEPHHNFIEQPTQLETENPTKKDSTIAEKEGRRLDFVSYVRSCPRRRLLHMSGHLN